ATAQRHATRVVASLQFSELRVSLAVYCLSSRRRHTRSERDWSSDVCSSDLGDEGADRGHLGEEVQWDAPGQDGDDDGDDDRALEIGRAPCRGRADMTVGFTSLKR